MAGQRRIMVDELRLGMYVSELDRPWLETPFLFQGFPVLTMQELEQLREYCNYVYIDDNLTTAIAPASTRHELEEHPVARFTTRKMNKPSRLARGSRQHPREFTDELPKARDLYQYSHSFIDGLFEDIRENRSVDVEQARELTNQTVESVLANENAMLWLAQLKRKDEYTSQHSINVSTVAIMFGSYLGLGEGELQMLGMGALLHDIGKMRIPLEVLNQTQRLSPEEISIMRQHPELGVAILDEAKGKVPPQVRAVVHAHHERYDGKGYPRGIKGAAIGKLPMIVTLADVYDAMTSDRVYRKRLSPHEVLNMMYSWGGSVFSPELLEEFIGCLGIYPVGSIVELNSGEVALVMTINRERHLLPQVLLVLDRDKRRYSQPKQLNLELFQHGGERLQISRILPSDAYDIDVRQIVMNFQPEAETAESE